MKKTILILSALIGVTVADAQITITTTDIATPTTTIYQAHDTIPTVTVGSAGTSMTYNMATLNTHYVDTLTFLPSSAAPNAHFPTANLLVQQGWQANYAYAVNSAANLRILGNAGTVNILGTNANVVQINAPAERLANFPETYLTTFNNNYRRFTPAFYYGGTIMGFTIDSIRMRGATQKTVLVDGWGTLTTPLGTYNVIRAKETKYNRDTIDAYAVLPIIGGSWQNAVQTTADTSYKYTYWANSIGFTLVTATVNAADSVLTVDWLMNLPVGVAEVLPPAESISEYPNPAENEINIVGNAIEQKTIEMFDIAGRLVGSYLINSNKTTISTSSFANGMYTYRITAKDNSIVKRGKFTINK